MTFRIKLLTVATVALCGTSLTETALAGAVSFAYLDISDFKIYKGPTSASPQFTIADFDDLKVDNFSDTSASLISANPPYSAIDTPNFPTPGKEDALQAKVGTGYPGENNFNQQAEYSGPFSRADQLLTGSVLEPTGAHNQQVSEAEIPIGPNTASWSASSLSGTSSEFSFVPTLNSKMTFDFYATLTEILKFGPDVQNGDSINAVSSFSITLIDKTDLNVLPFQFSPIEINTSITLFPQPGGNKESYTFGGWLTYTTPEELKASNTYLLKISSSTQVYGSVTEGVPEIDAMSGTAALTLMGISLALAGERRRRGSWKFGVPSV